MKVFNKQMPSYADVTQLADAAINSTYRPESKRLKGHQKKIKYDNKVV